MTGRRERIAGLAGIALAAWMQAAPAWAADLRAALGHVPATVVARGHALLAGTVDLADLGAIPVPAGEENGLGRLAPAVASEPLRAFLMNGARGSEGDWKEKTGIATNELSGFVVFGEPPGTVTIWRFPQPGRAASFLTGLEARGFTRSPDGSLSNGEPLAIDPKRRSYTDPLIDSLGRASVLAQVGESVAQAHDPKALAALRGPGERLADLPPVAAALTGLDKVASGARIPQATILGIGAWTPDVATVVLDPAKVPKLPGPGTPPALAAVLADVEQPDGRRGAVLAIGYGDCTTAKKATSFFAESWRTVLDRGGKTPLERTGAEPVTGEIEAKGGCAAVVSLMAARPDGVRNPVYRYVIDALIGRDLKALQGG